MRCAETLGKIDGDGFSLDGAEALSLSSAVDCRIGSLEIFWPIWIPLPLVDCRIGSLEIPGSDFPGGISVDCRIGSLEKKVNLVNAAYLVDCRIGSLEIVNEKRH